MAAKAPPVISLKRIDMEQRALQNRRAAADYLNHWQEIQIGPVKHWQSRFQRRIGLQI